MLIKSNLTSNYIVEEITEHKCSQKYPRKKVKVTNNKKAKEKVLVSKKIQENQRRNIQKEMKNNKQMKITEKAWIRWKSKKKT